MGGARFAWRLLILAGVTASLSGCSSGQSNKRVFITRALLPANLGGLTGADTQCTNFATAAGIDSMWKAWLSDSTTNALDRIADVGPWVDMNGRRVFRDKAQLMGFPDMGLGIDETRTTWGGYYWTGTALGGTKSSSNCADWTDGSSGQGTAGVTGNIDQWTDAVQPPCNQSQRLLCFEQ